MPKKTRAITRIDYFIDRRRRWSLSLKTNFENTKYRRRQYVITEESPASNLANINSDNYVRSGTHYHPNSGRLAPSPAAGLDALTQRRTIPL